MRTVQTSKASAAASVSPVAAPGAPRAPRDLRLDFFRGLAMFIILLAHTPGNAWTLWIPARFGFSDATEIFVFCSGMASALAFGAVFVKRSWWLGAARIAFRVWQVYWAHIGIFLATAMLAFAIDHFGIGLEGKKYVHEPYVVPFFTQTGEAVLGLMTLTYVPGMFDILPMYLVILAMIPAVMLCHRLGGRWAVFGAVLAVWLASNLAGYASMFEPESDPAPWQSTLLGLGEALAWMNLPANPFGENTWFFNPFAWQLVFFTGFAFGLGWLPAPPVRRWLVILAAAYLVVVLPFAWFKIHQGFYIPQEWALAEWIRDTRAATEPVWWKSWLGGARYLHFLAVAYLAWASVGPGGVFLREGFRPRAALPRWLVVLAGAVVLVSVPYTYIDGIKALSPALDAWFFNNIPIVHGNRIGLIQLIHLAAVIVLVWALLGTRLRNWLAGDFVRAAVPVIRKVGTQSLAVFMVSIPLARLNGWVLDMIGRDAWTWAAVNLSGFAVLIAVAYVVSWFKGMPWRAQPAARVPAPGAAQIGGADGRGAPQIAAMRV
ncbi:MAG TPA: OpgC domain-containing protein [Thermohalobaculum sp.]|nr:OpgC domain-containing protein [Thermohalobaculum sp.]